MLKIHASSQLIDFFEEFNKSYQKSSIFEQIQVIVPSASINESLCLYLANKNNICGSFPYSYLGAWIWQTLNNSKTKKVSPYLSQSLRWYVYKFLKNPEQTKPFTALQNYLNHCDELMTFELSQEIARILERYTIFRTDWIKEWSLGNSIKINVSDTYKQGNIDLHSGWQAALWQYIAEETDTTKVHPLNDFIENALENKLKLPDQLHIFCDATLPPLYIKVIQAIAHNNDVHLYVLNPCREFWLDIVSPKIEAYAKQKGQDYKESINPLLSSWGGERKKTLSALLEYTDVDIEPTNRSFITDSNKTVLSRVQASIFNLEEIGDLSSCTDSSIEVHVAYSRTREVEILHDQLLRRFKENPNAKPEDFLVVVSDLQESAVIIESVFDSLEPKIPYTITGHSQTSNTSISSALIEILSLSYSRITTGDFLNVISHPLIAQKFELSKDDITTIYEWLVATGACWGLDGTHKESFEILESVNGEKNNSYTLPGEEKFTFNDAFHRLFLAYAFSNNSVDTSELNRLPAGKAFGTQATVLGKFWEIYRFISGLTAIIKEKHKIEEWQKIIIETIDDFIEVPMELKSSYYDITQNITRIFAEAQKINPEQTYNYPVINKLLEEIIEEELNSARPTGQVTFCNMQNMRLIPYDYIFILGMDEKTYPSKLKPREFDLIAATEEPLDITRLDIDRNTFLDLVLAAKKELYISYTGRSIKDNSIIPPSTLVAELIDVLTKATTASFSQEDLKRAHDRYVFDHPLQAFSERYFANPPELKQIMSFQQSWADALNEKYNNSKSDDRFLLDDIIFNQEEKTVNLNELVKFFRNPARYLLQERLGARFMETEEELPSTEKIELDNDALLRDFLISYMLRDPEITDEHLFTLIKSSNKWPSNIAMDTEIRNTITKTSQFVDQFREQYNYDQYEPITKSVDITLGNGDKWTINGSVSNLKVKNNNTMALHYSAYRESARVILPALIEHAFLCGAGLGDQETTTEFHFWDTTKTTIPHLKQEEAKGELKKLLEYFLKGQENAINFLPKSALKLSTPSKKDSDDSFNTEDDESKKKKLISKINSSKDIIKQELEDSYSRLLYRGRVNVLNFDDENNIAFWEDLSAASKAIFAIYQENKK